MTGIGKLVLQLVERDLPIGAAKRGMQILGERRSALDPDDAVVLVDELPCRWDQGHRAHAGLEIVDRTEHFEIELGQPVAEALKRHIVEYDIGRAAIWRRLVASALFRSNQSVGVLLLVAAIDPDREFRLVELLAVGPDASDPRDRPLADRIGRVGKVVILLDFDLVALRRALRAEHVLAASRLAAAGCLRRGLHLFLETGRPDELSRQTRPSIDAGKDRALA